MFLRQTFKQSIFCIIFSHFYPYLDQILFLINIFLWINTTNIDNGNLNDLVTGTMKIKENTHFALIFVCPIIIFTSHNFKLKWKNSFSTIATARSTWYSAAAIIISKIKKLTHICTTLFECLWVKWCDYFNASSNFLFSKYQILFWIFSWTFKGRA